MLIQRDLSVGMFSAADKQFGFYEADCTDIPFLHIFEYILNKTVFCFHSICYHSSCYPIHTDTSMVGEKKKVLNG